MRTQLHVRLRLWEALSADDEAEDVEDLGTAQDVITGIEKDLAALRHLVGDVEDHEEDEVDVDDDVRGQVVPLTAVTVTERLSRGTVTSLVELFAVDEAQFPWDRFDEPGSRSGAGGGAGGYGLKRPSDDRVRKLGPQVPSPDGRLDAAGLKRKNRQAYDAWEHDQPPEDYEFTVSGDGWVSAYEVDPKTGDFKREPKFLWNEDDGWYEV